MIEIITDPAALKPIANGWQELAKVAEMPLLDYSWNKGCADDLSCPGQLRIVVIRSHGEIAAIAPVVLVKNQGVERLE